MPDFTRFRVVTDQGILAVFDADEDWDGRDEPASQLAYWNDYATEQLFFFDQLLFTEADVLQSVAAMQRDLDIDPVQILSEKPEFAPLPELAAPGQWRPATELDVLTVMAGGTPGARKDGVVSGLPLPCDPVGCPEPQSASGPLPGPVRGTPRSELFAMAQRGSKCNCTGGGGCSSGCPDPDQCTRSHCENGSCVNVPINCEDGSLCTQDSCDPVSGCVHIPMNCPAVDACTMPECNSQTGCRTDSYCQVRPQCCGDLGWCCESDQTCCRYNIEPAGCCPLAKPYCCDNGSLDSPCCATAADCCNGDCKEPCDTVCAADGWHSGPPCGSTWCQPWQVCCNGTCCGTSPCFPGECLGTICVPTARCDEGNDCTEDPCTVRGCNEYTCDPKPPKSGPCEDDGNVCTNDICADGECTHPPKCDGQLCCSDGHCCPLNSTCCDTGCCTAGQVCCGGETCCEPESCCGSVVARGDNDGAVAVVSFCCAAVCNDCIQYGLLSGGTVTVSPDPVCVGDTITWTAADVEDSGGKENVECVETDIAPGGILYEWTLTLPPNYPSPPPLTGTGASVNVTASIPGTYSCTFVAKPLRTQCSPPDLPLGSKTTKAIIIHPKSVTFLGSVTTIKKDDGSGDYPTPHWKDNSTAPPDDDNDDVGDHNIPVGYVRNEHMVLSAEFIVEPSDGLDGTIIVDGIGFSNNGKYLFSSSGPASGGLIAITGVASDVPLPSEVGYFQPLYIEWSFRPPGGEIMTCARGTEHLVYILLGAPTAGSPYESVVDIACRSAIGATDSLSTMNNTYGDFLDRDVKRKVADGFNNPDGKQMRYWVDAGDPLLPTVSVNCQTLSSMLDPTPTNPSLDGIGTCLAWANLLLECSNAHGITGPAIVEVTSARHNDLGMTLDGFTDRGEFLVKRWSFLPNGNAPVPCFPFSHLSSEVTDLTGAPGQGASNNPPGAFFNHFIVKYSGAFYDPSYGTPIQQNQANWESASLDGYLKKCSSGPTIVIATETAAVETTFVP